MSRTTLAVDVAADTDRVFEVLSTTEGQRGSICIRLVHEYLALTVVTGSQP